MHKSAFFIVFIATLYNVTIYCAAEPTSSAEDHVRLRTHISAFHKALREQAPATIDTIEPMLRALSLEDRATIVSSPVRTAARIDFNTSLYFALSLVASPRQGHDLLTKYIKLVRILIEQTSGKILARKQSVILHVAGRSPSSEHCLHYLIHRLWNQSQISQADINLFCNIFDLLISWGASLNALNKDEKTPLEQARLYLSRRGCNTDLVNAIIARLEAWQSHLAAIRQLHTNATLLLHNHDQLRDLIPTILSYRDSVPFPIPPTPIISARPQHMAYVRQQSGS